MPNNRIDEGPAAPLITQGSPIKVTRSLPLKIRRRVYWVRRRPGLARRYGLFMIWPNGRSNILPGWER